MKNKCRKCIRLAKLTLFGVGMFGVLLLTGCGKAAESTSGAAVTPVAFQATTTRTSADALVLTAMSPGDRVAPLPVVETQALAQLSDTGLMPAAKGAGGRQMMFARFVENPAGGRGFSPFSQGVVDADGYELRSGTVTDNAGNTLFRYESSSKSTRNMSVDGLRETRVSHAKWSRFFSKSYGIEGEDQRMIVNTVYNNKHRYSISDGFIDNVTASAALLILKLYQNGDGLRDNAIPTAKFVFSNVNFTSVWNYNTMRGQHAMDYPGEFVIKSGTTGQEFRYDVRFLNKTKGRIEIVRVRNGENHYIRPENAEDNVMSAKLMKNGVVVGVLRLHEGDDNILKYRAYVFDANGRVVPVEEYIQRQTGN